MLNELSIIVPTLNEARYLPKLLDSISAQNYSGKLQVIVVDAHSSDSTAKIAHSYANEIPDLLMLASKKDIGHQRNYGAKHAKYRYLLFLDADVLLPEHFLERLSAKVRDNKPFIYAVMHKFQNISFVDRIFFCIGCFFLAIFLLAIKPLTNGDFILTNRENFDNVGGFKENVLIGEDVDFGKRSIEAGAKFRFLFRPQVIGSLRRAYKMGRTKMLLLYVRIFLRVAKHGPIYKGQLPRNKYPFGHYDNQDKPTAT